MLLCCYCSFYLLLLLVPQLPLVLYLITAALDVADAFVAVTVVAVTVVVVTVVAVTVVAVTVVVAVISPLLLLSL